jgi:alkylation response protein AidB-like acyl-CoA dehydrogenase
VKLARLGEGYLLSGGKTFASGLGHVKRAIVTASIDDGAAPRPQMLFLAFDERPPIEDRSFWQPLGMRASASYRAGFDGRHVSRDEFIGTVCPAECRLPPETGEVKGLGRETQLCAALGRPPES